MYMHQSRIVVPASGVEGCALSCTPSCAMCPEHRGFARNAFAVALAAFAIAVPAVPVSAAAPTVDAVKFLSSPQSGDTYGVGERITVEVEWNESVLVTGSPRLALTVGSNTRYAEYAGGANPRFRYTVGSRVRDLNGLSVAAGALELNGGAIRSESTSENADIGLGSHAITDDSSHKVDGSIAVAAIVTAVRITTRPSGGRAYFRTGERIRVEVRFGKPVSASSIVRPRLALSIGDTTRQVSAAASSGYSEFLTFDYTVQSGDYDADGFSIAAGALTLGRVVDRGARAANLNLGRHAISSAAGHRVNNAPPSFGSATVANRKFDTDTPIAPLVLPEATGEGTLSYTLTPSTMPQGLTWTSATRTIAGTPTTVTAARTYTWKATDSEDETATLTFTIAVAEIPSFGSAAGPALRYEVNQPIASFSLPAATGGDGALTYALGTTPALPEGLSYTPPTGTATGGVIAGTPTEVKAERTYTLTATDTDGDAATFAFTIRVVNHPVVSEVRIMDWGTNGVYYSGEEIRIFVGFSSSITVWGNTDLAIVIGGQTRRARRHSFNTTGIWYSYTVQDSDFDTDGISIPADAHRLTSGVVQRTGTGQSVDMAIGGLAVTDAPDHKVGSPRFATGASVPAQSYTQRTLIDSLTLPTATGVATPLTYALGATPALPAGLTYTAPTSGNDHGGVIAGTPTAALAQTTYTFSATDTNGRSDSLTFTITVDGIPTFGDATVADQSWVQRRRIAAFTLPAAAGGDGVLTYALSPSLPGGVTRDAATHVVSGAPSTSQTATTYTWTATDADGDKAELAFTIAVEGVPAVTLATADSAIAENGGTTTVTATLSHAWNQAMTVTVTPVAGSYTVGQDATIAIAAGSTANASDSVTITAVNDDLDNVGDRSVTVSGTAGSARGAGSVTGAPLTLTDDEATPTATLVLSPASIAEGAWATVAATLDRASSEAVTLTVSAAAGANASDGDFTLSSTRTLAIAAGSTSSSGTVTITATRDASDSPDKEVTVSASVSGSSGVAAPASRTLTITDDGPPTVTLALADSSISENGGTTTVSATLTSAWTSEVVVTLSGLAGAYAVGADTTIAIPAGQTQNSSDTVTVTAVDNATDAPDRSVTVAATAEYLAPGSLTRSVGVSGAALTLEDDDAAPYVTVQTSTLRISENGGTADLSATSSHPSSAVTKVTISVAPSSRAPAGDYVLSRNRVLTIAAGATTSTGTVTVAAVDNDRDEPDRWVVLRGTPQNSQGASQYAGLSLAIDDDEAAPAVTLAVADGAVDEDGGTTTVTATLSHASSEATTITVTALDGAYTVGSDATIVIAAGATSNASDTAAITAVDDDVDNVGNRTVTVTATADNSHDVGTVTGASLTLTDDEETPAVTLALSEPDTSKPDTIAESGPGNASTVTATLSGPSSEAVTLTVSAAPGANAEAGDFTLSPAKTLTIAAGATASADTVTVAAVDDTKDAPDKEVTVSAAVSGASGVAAPADATLTITDDDDPPAVSISSPSVSEGAAGTTATLRFEVTLGTASGRQVTVDYAESATGRTATPGTDYTALASGTLTIAAGDTSGVVAVTVAGDGTDEPDEQVKVVLSGPVNATLGTATGTGTIDDDDAAPAVTLALSASSVPENGGSTTVTATLSHASSEATTVTVTAVSGAYTVGSDATIVIAAGATSNASDTAAITAVDDDVDNVGNRTVTVTATAANDHGIGTVTGASLTLTDDEGTPTVTLALSEPDTSKPDTIAESGSGNASTVTATLSGPSSEAVTLTVSAAPGANAAAGDFTLSPAKTLTIAAGATVSAGTVTVTAVDDTKDAPDKSVTVSAAVSGSSGVAAPSARTLAITDDDAAPAVTLTLASSSVSENGGVSTVTATLSHPSSATTTVTVTAVSGFYTAGTDATIVIAAGATSNASDTATVNAVDDAIDNVVNRAVTVTGTAANAQAIAESETMTVTGASLTLADDDTAGFAASPSTSASSRLRTTEDGGTAGFTVKLGSEPTGDVVLGVASSDTTEGTVSVSSLTFTATTWSTAQTVTLTGVDDAPANPADGDRNYTVTLTVNMTSTADATYDALSAVTVYAVNADNEYGLDVGSVTGQATEAGGTAAFTVALVTRPLQAVTVTVTSRDTSEGAASPSSLTFTDSDWNVTQTVTVTGADDAIDDGDVTWAVRLDPSSGDANYDGLSNVDVSVTTTDDDAAPGVTLSLSPSSIAEAGGVATVTAALSRASSAATTVTVTAVPGFYTVGSDAVIVIAAGSTSNATDAVTVAAVDNDTDAPDRAGTVTATVSNDRATADGTTLAVSGGALTVTDDDAAPNAALSLNPASVSENGGASAVSATLTHPSSEPTTVTVTAVSGAYTVGSDATIVIAAGETASATDTAAITAVDNAKDEPDRTATVTATLTNGQGAGTVTGATLTLTDDDAAPGVTLSVASSSIPENGGSTTVSATLTHPSSAVTTVTVTGVSGFYTVGSDATIVIAAGETANATDTATIMAVDNAKDEPDRTVTVTATASNSQDIGTVTGADLTLTDDEGTPTVTLALSEPDTSNPDTIAESGSGNASTVTATLSGPSSEAVTLTVSAAPGTNAEAGDFTLSSAKTLTIAAGATASAGTVTVAAVDDTKDAPDKSVTVSAAVSGSSGVAAPSARTLTITDDDAAPAVTLTLAPSSVSENGGVSTVTATLSHPSSATTTVTVTAVSGFYTAGTDATIVIAAGATSNASDTATVNAVDDAIDNVVNRAVTVTGTAANAQAIAESETMTVTGASLTLADDDTAGFAASPSTSASSRLRTTEDGGTAGFTVKLGSEPTGDVVLGVASSDTTEGTVSVSSLTFTATTWSTAQTVTLTGVDDAPANPADGDRSYTVTLTVNMTSTADAVYDALSAITVYAVNADNEYGLDVGAVTGQATEAGGTAAFTVALLTRPSAAVTVSVTSRDTSEGAASPSSLIFETSDWDTAQAVTVTGADDAIDDGDVAWAVRLDPSSGDANYDGLSNVDVSVTTTDDDAAPGVTLSLSPSSIAENGGVSTVTATLTHPSGAATTVTVTPVPGFYAVGSDAVIVIAAGETANASDTATVAAVDNATDAPDRAGTVTVTVSNDRATADGTTLAVSGGALTVTDDDAAPNAALSLNPSSVSENGGASAVSATLTHPSSEPTTVTVTPVSGAYTVGSDATIVIAAGETANGTDTAAIAAVDNAKDEPDRTATVTATLTNGQGAGTVTGATLTLTDDDAAPSLSIDSPRVGEGDSGSASLTFTVSLSAVSGRQVTVGYADGGTGTAAAGSDYTAVGSGTLTFAAGETGKTVTVTVTGDETDEPDETVVVNLSGAVNAVIGTASGTGTITDDDATPTVTLALSEPDTSKPDTVNESGAGNSSTVTATLSGRSSAEVILTVAATAGANAVAGDFVLSSVKTLTIVAGATASAGTVTVTAVDDTKDAPDKSVTVSATVSGSSGVAVPPARTLTITDDDDAPGVTLALSASSISENGGVSTVTATLSHPSSATTTVTVTAVRGLYTVGADATIVIAAGEMANATDTATIMAVDNSRDEADRTGTVTGTAANAQGAGTVSGATLTLEDDDAAPGVTLVVSPSSISENGGGSTVTATLAHPSSAATTVTVTAVSGFYTVGSDAEIVIAAGETANTADKVTIAAVDNATDAPDRAGTVTATVSNDRATGSVTGGALTVTDDDAAPNAALSLNPASVSENGGASAVSATLTHPSSAATTVTVTGVSGACTVGSDATIVIAAGETANATDTAAIAAVDNTKDEPDRTATVTATLTNSQGAGTVSGATLTLTDDDAAPGLSISSPSVDEGATGTTATLRFEVSLGAASGRQVTVGYADAGTGTATSGTDYTAISAGTLTFAAGETAKTLTVSVTGDTTDEPDETVVVSLSGSVNAAISTASGTGTITDDDATPTVTLALSEPDASKPDTVNESGAGNSSTVTATLGGRSSAEVILTVAATAGANAVAGDFALSSAKTLTIAAGSTASTGAVTVTAVDDTKDAPDKSVTVSAAVSGASGVAAPSAVTLTITDDDEEPLLSIDSPSVAEGDSGSANLEFTVSLSAASGRQVTVGYADAGTGTAAAGTDYTAISAGALTFAAGETGKTLTVTVTGDETSEPDETVVVSLSGAVNAVIGTASGTGTITDDDATPTVTLALSEPDASKPDTVNESGAGNSSTVTATLDGRSSADVILTVAATAGANAVAGDFALSPAKTLTIAAGATASAGTVTVTAVDDTKDAPDKEVTVSAVVSGSSGVAAPSAVTLTITDDDGEPSLSIDSPSVAEGDSGSAHLVFTVTLSAASGRQVTVGYAESATGRTATPGTDYTALASGTLTIAAGDTSGVVAVTVVGDGTDEPDEQVKVVLSGPVNATLGTATGTGTIDDDDAAPAVMLMLSSSSILENGGVATVTAVLSRPSSAATTLTVSASAGAHTTAADFTQTGMTLTVAAGATASTGVVTVAAVDDAEDPEHDKAVTVAALAANDQGVAGNPAVLTLTILDEDSTAVRGLFDLAPSFGDATVSARRYRVGAAVFEELPQAMGGDGTLAYLLVPALPPGLTFDGVARTLSGTPDELAAEATYTFTAMDADGDTAELKFSIEVVAPVRLSLADAAAVEGEGVAFVLHLSPAPARAMVVMCVTEPMTATAHEDYAHVTEHRVAIAAGQRSIRVVIPTVDDDEVESDETFTLSLIPEWKAVRGVRATGTITDNDAAARARTLRMMLAAFGRTVASEAVGVVGERFTDVAAGPHVTLSGRRLVAGAVGDAEPVEFGREVSHRREGAAGRTVSAREVVSDSGFALTFGVPEEAGSGARERWAVWGHTGRARFSGRAAGDMEIEGEVFSGYVGVDARVHDDLLVGVALSHSEGEMSYTMGEERGGMDARLTSVLPYGRWTAGEGLSVWGLMGAGWGQGRLKDRWGEVETGMGMELLAMGWRKEWGGEAGMQWALKGDGFAVEMDSETAPLLPAVRAGAQRLRLVLESAMEWSLAGHGRVRAAAEFGGRWDGGDADRGYGTEVGGSVKYVDPRLGVGLEGRGRYLLGHESEGFRAWGASLGMKFDPGGDGEGVWIGVSPRWGAPAGSGVESLWGSGPSGGVEGSSVRMGVEAGYRSGDALDVSVTVEREKTDGASAPIGVTFRTRVRW